MKKMKLFLFFIVSFVISYVKAQSGCWKMVSAGMGHTVAIKNDSTLWAWGSNFYGQLGIITLDYFQSTPVQVGMANNWKIVTTNANHTVAIKTDGTLWSWGNNDVGQLGNATNYMKTTPVQVGVSNNWQSVCTGSNYTIAIKTDGTLWSWGNNDVGQLGNGTNINTNTPIQIGTDNNWKTVKAGYQHTIAVKTNGTLWSWGGNTYGQLGDGTYINKNSPKQIGINNNWKLVDAGKYHTAAIRADSTLWTWGYNNYGQLGDGTVISKIIPKQIGTSNIWETLSVGGGNNTIAKRIDGTLWGWGYNNYGQLGDGTNANKKSPIQIGIVSNWETFSAGNAHTIAIKIDGTLWAWGRGYAGQLGNGLVGDKMSPVQINYVNNWQTFSAGAQHATAIKADGTLWSWGLNDNGQIGDGTNLDKSSPVQIGIDKDWQTASSVSHTLAIKNNGTLWAWGGNNFGQLGDGTTINKNTPMQIGIDNDWKSVSTGGWYSLAMKSNGTLWAWGWNNLGQLGIGSNGDKKRPIQVGTSNNWKIVSAASGLFTVAIKTDGTLWVWGDNVYGQLGNGTSGTSTGVRIPIQVGTSNDWKLVDGGGEHIVAIKSDGTLWAWGRNTYGQLGDGTTVDKNIPVQIGTANDWQNLSAGNAYTLAIKNDGTLWAWGLNTFGELGDGTTKSKTTPVKIDTNTNWRLVSGGNQFTLGFKKDNTLWTWGYNNYGQLGDGTTWVENSIKIATCFGSCLPAKTFANNYTGCTSVLHNGITYSTSTTLRDTTISTFGCDSVYRIVDIIIQPNNISGNLIHPTKVGIDNATLKVTGSHIYNREVSKNYMDSCNNLGDNLTYKFTKNNDIKKNNGVSSIDVILTQRHILNTTKLNSPYKLIAADVNNNKTITNIDVIFMKRLILGIDTTFTGNRLWAFVDSAYKFPDTTNPFPYKDSISFTNLTSNKTNQSFIGVKLGDVNYDWNAAVARGKSIDNVELIIDNVEPKIDKQLSIVNYQLPIKVKNFKDLTALQYTLHFNHDLYDLTDITDNKLGIEYNVAQANATGNISFLWADAKGAEKTLEDGTEIFTLVLKSKLGMVNGEWDSRNLELGITNDITEIEAWDKDNQQHKIILNKKETPINNLPLTINNWVVSPNPNDGNIVVSLYSNTNKNIVFELSNTVGKTLYTQNFEAMKGSNSFHLNLNKNTKLSSGVYFIKAIGMEGDSVKRIVVNRE